MQPPTTILHVYRFYKLLWSAEGGFAGVVQRLGSKRFKLSPWISIKDDEPRALSAAVNVSVNDVSRPYAPYAPYAATATPPPKHLSNKLISATKQLKSVSRRRSRARPRLKSRKMRVLNLKSSQTVLQGTFRVASPGPRHTQKSLGLPFVLFILDFHIHFHLFVAVVGSLAFCLESFMLFAH